MLRAVKVAGVLILLILSVPAVLLVILYWPKPLPPSPPDWRPVYDKRIARGDGEMAASLLQSALLVSDSRALMLCKEHPDLTSCRNFAGPPDDLDAAIERALDIGDLQRHAKTFDPFSMVLNLTALSERFHERRSAGLRFALGDGWLYTRCIYLMTRAPATSELLAQTLAQIEGETYKASPYERAVASCDVRKHDFARNLEQGVYGPAARTYAADWK